MGRRAGLGTAAFFLGGAFSLTLAAFGAFAFGAGLSAAAFAGADGFLVSFLSAMD